MGLGRSTADKSLNNINKMHFNDIETFINKKKLRSNLLKKELKE